MDIKKNPSKDIHRKRSAFFLIGICVSLLMVVSAFEWKTRITPRLTRQSKNEPDMLYQVPVISLPEPRSPAKSNFAKPLTVAIIPVESTENSAAQENRFPAEEPAADSLVFEWTEPLPEESAEEIHIGAEQMPQPEGGYDKFYKYLSKTLKYPSRAIRAQVEGKVFVEFTVMRDGSIQDLKVLKGIGFGCDEEAVRVLTQSKWEPGKQRGKPVHVRMVQPLIFEIP